MIRAGRDDAGFDQHTRLMVRRKGSVRRTAGTEKEENPAGTESIGSGILGKPALVVRPDLFLNLEMPAELVNSWITPVRHFFVRNHSSEPPRADLKRWTLAVLGEVHRPLELRFADLRRFPSASVVNTLECAGNGRAFFDPHTHGLPWQRGAVGTARFSGIRLRDVLGKAGVKDRGLHVMFRGGDEPAGNASPFIRSIPIAKALHPDTLIATHMNGRPLLNHHGFPARALVPGWIGAASVKWLSEIRILREPYEGGYMNPGYCLPRSPLRPGEAMKPEDSVPITAMGVKSIIVRPLDGATLNRGLVRMSGTAWAGEQQVVRVDVSTDGGGSWHEAQLDSRQAPYAWRLWTYAWQPAAAGNYVLMSRATDTAGNTQPAGMCWNPGGYMWNAIDRVKVHVKA